MVISTAYKRKVHESLNSFDFGVTDKTVAMNTLGDTGMQGLLIHTILTDEAYASRLRRDLDAKIQAVMRKLPTARYTFNDLKNDRRHRSFFQRYKDAYNRVRRGRGAVATGAAGATG